MSLTSSDLRRKTVPAQLGFLAIYNPTLEATEETEADQIAYYSSPGSRKLKRRPNEENKVSKEELDERLKAIGLAQGMVKFAREFSNGRSMDTIETEKSRIILHEIEPAWWIIAVSRANN